MPTYPYVCITCGNKIDLKMGIAAYEELLKTNALCGNCKDGVLRRVWNDSPPAIHL